MASSHADSEQIDDETIRAIGILWILAFLAGYAIGRRGS